ncbi:MAG: hypothetical protein MJY75_03275 [Bacteroidaceae bacterium]|nr:hypothetical protein [Bacteroidaceae bacterium]
MKVILFFRRFVTLLLFVLLQVFVFGRINLFGYAAPLFYVWMILHMESHMSRSAVLLWSFFLGLAVDVFTATPGLNAATATLTGFLQPVAMNISTRIDRHDTLRPSCESMGWRRFMLFSMSLIFIHILVYFILRGTPEQNTGIFVTSVLSSFAITFTLVFFIDLAFSEKADNRPV